MDSEVDGGERGKGALEGADGSSRDGANVDFGHFFEFLGEILGAPLS